MSITRDEVAHLARLSRLALTDAELDHLGGQLDQIIALWPECRRSRQRAFPPMTHAVPVVNVFRDDVELACLTPEQALSGSTCRRAGQVQGPAHPGGGLIMTVDAAARANPADCGPDRRRDRGWRASPQSR